MPISKSAVIVTGAAGFVGRAVIEALAPNHLVFGLDREDAGPISPLAERIALDVTSDASISNALARIRVAFGTSIASVIHLAAYFDLTGEPDPRYDSVTVQGTGRLIDALQAFDVEQFVFMSTMLVHAPSGHDRRIDEDAPLDDHLPYADSKIRTERLLRERHGRIPVVLLRPAGIYDDACHSAFLSHQIADIHQRRFIAHLYPGDLRAGQSYLHLADLTDAVLRVVDRRHQLPAETTLLLGEAEVMGYDDVQRDVGRLLHGEAWQTVEMPKAIARTGAWVEAQLLQEDPFVRPWMVDISSDHYAIDTRRAEATLGWRPRHHLHETLPKMIAALRADPVAWYRANELDEALVAADAAQATGPSPTLDHRAGEAAMKSMRQAHFSMLWVHWLNILLGAWLVASPFVFGSFDAGGRGGGGFSAAVLQVTADRHLLDPGLRSLLLGRSDILSGMLVMLFGTLSLSPRFSWAQWANATMGTWLLFAPLVFWAPGAAAYANDSLIGALVIAFAVLVPMMPGMGMAGMADGSDLPPGWNHSPSSYLQRLPIVALGAFGFLIARVLTAYQLGHIGAVWEPFFHGNPPLNGTETIITSRVSKAWPIPDAGLGGVAYAFELLMGVMGDSRRWRTMPWMVAMFGIVVVPLGIVSIWFIVIQPIVIGTWCTLCLITAAAMLVMIPFSLDELVATGQFLKQSRQRGEPFWRTFFTGGAQPAGKTDASADFDAPISKSFKSAVRGVTMPWSLVASALLGAALMLTRVLFGSVPPLANSDHLVGALVVTVSVIAMAEVGRALRWLNIGFGLWLLAAPWVLGGAGGVAPWAEVLIGLALIGLSLPRGQLSKARYGAWDRWVL